MRKSRMLALLIGIAIPVIVTLVVQAQSRPEQGACYEERSVTTDGTAAGGFDSADAAFHSTRSSRSWDVGQPGVTRQEEAPGEVRYRETKDGQVEQEYVASQNQSGAWFLMEMRKRIPCPASAR